MKKVVMSAAVCGAMVLGAAGAQAQSGEFDGSTFTCLQYTSGQGDNSSTKAQVDLAKLWMMGYLTGYYKAKGNLELVDEGKAKDSVLSALVSKCRENPSVTIMTVGLQAIATDARKMPSKPSDDIDLTSYTCANHVDARGGAASQAMKADLAELWAFAFIQGYKNLNQPDMVIPMENKPVLTGAITKNCGKNLDKTFLDLTAMVAQAVKLGG
ncbi:MAG: hypothetical protein SFV19_04645 [Rhodospirillaceae bacterium]|nr:hypothetical protein [Rhodospirillaceae bacterium]